MIAVATVLAGACIGEEEDPSDLAERAIDAEVEALEHWCDCVEADCADIESINACSHEAYRTHADGNEAKLHEVIERAEAKSDCYRRLAECNSEMSHACEDAAAEVESRPLTRGLAQALLDCIGDLL